MHRSAITALLLALGAAFLALSSPASGASSPSAELTCKQLTKAQIQPLVATSITSVKVTPEGLRIKAGETSGQQCVFGASNGRAIDVLVDKGSFGESGFRQEVAAFHGKVKVAGVAATAYREKGDFQIVALRGDEYCSVSVGSADTIPGVAALQRANNGHSELPERVNAIIARALGTVCNRVYGAGNVKPSLAGIATTP